MIGTTKMVNKDTEEHQRVSRDFFRKRTHENTKNGVVPEMAKPLKPTAMVRHAIAVEVSFVNPTPRRNNASKPKPATYTSMEIMMQKLNDV